MQVRHHSRLTPNATEAIKASNAKHRARIALLRSTKAARRAEADLAGLGLPVVIEHFGAWLGADAAQMAVWS